jgi:hypothetical protein
MLGGVSFDDLGRVVSRAVVDDQDLGFPLAVANMR